MKLKPKDLLGKKIQWDGYPDLRGNRTTRIGIVTEIDKNNISFDGDWRYFKDMFNIKILEEESK